jgi:3-oxoacyl-[acyl-carrier-protein] synthase-3
MDTSDEWITKRSGIKERRWVELDVTTSDISMWAAEKALEDAGVDKNEIDLIVLATNSPDHEMPPTACFLQKKMGLKNIPAWDVRQACSAFVYALSLADQYIRTGMYNKILVVGADIFSKSMEAWEHIRELAVLFADGAGAVVLGAVEGEVGFEDPHIFSTHLHTDGEGAKDLWCKAPGQAYHGPRITHEAIDRLEHLPSMNGQAVFLHAIQRMPEAIHEALDYNELKPDDIDLFIFHQANLRINEMVTRVLGVPKEKVHHTIQKFGNTTAATIPLGLDDAIKAGKLKPGMLVAIAAFGSGFTWGSAIIRW